MNSSPAIDAIILDLDEHHLARESAHRLKREGARVFVADNGSEEEYRGPGHIVRLPENRGPSVGRNEALKLTAAPFVFLLDGDILYVPGTLRKMAETWETLESPGCLGVHNPVLMNGTLDREKADQLFPSDPGKPYSDFDMAWTQYGLFDGEWLRAHPFVTEGPFGEAGSGFEDDWIWHEMDASGLRSYYLPDVTYYHEKHGGQRWFDARGMDSRVEERKAAFKERWGRPWNEKDLHAEWLRDNPQ